MSMTVAPNKDLVVYLYKRTRSAPVLEVTNKNNQVTSFSGAWYGEYSSFSIPSSYVNSNNFPATFRYKLNGEIVKQYSVQLEAAQSNGDLADIEQRLSELESAAPPPVDLSEIETTLTQMQSRLLPEAGDATQMLIKASSETGDATWVDPVTPVIASIRPWVAAELLYTQNFLGATSLPTGWTSVNTASVAFPATTSVGLPPFPAYDNAVSISGNTNTTAYLNLDLSALSELSGKTVTKIVFYDSIRRGPLASGPAWSYQDGGTTKHTWTSPSAGASTAWTKREYALGAKNNHRWNITTGATGGNAYYVTGLEIYGQVEPYTLNELVAYNNTIWRSTMNNNPYTPGSGQGWVEA